MQTWFFYVSARTSSLLLCVGVGSYLAYRLCLKIFGCQNLSSLMARLKSDYHLWAADDEDFKTFEKLKVGYLLYKKMDDGIARGTT